MYEIYNNGVACAPIQDFQNIHIDCGPDRKALLLLVWMKKIGENLTLLIYIYSNVCKIYR